MLPPIHAINLPAAVEPIRTVAPTPAGASFGSALSEAVQHVQNSSRQADAAAQDFLAGGNSELHTTILAAQSAELDFEMLMQVRNKVVSAYEEIMRMQV